MREIVRLVWNLLKKTGAVLEYAALIRVPLLLAAGLGAFPLLAAPEGALTAFLFAMYDLHPLDMVFTGAGVFFYWLAICVCSSTTLATPQRFDPPPLPDWFNAPLWFGLPRGIAGLSALFLIPAAAFFWGLLRHAPESSGGWPAAMAGAGGAAALSIGAAVIHVKFDFIDQLPRAVLFWTRWTPCGFRVGNVPDGALHPAHEFAGGMAILFLLFYALLGWRGVASGYEIPTLPGLLLILTTICWYMSGLVYLFDRWRLPLLAVLVFAALVGARWDHVFPVLPWEQGRRVPIRTAKAMVELGNSQGGTIVVGTSGGGILAAGWTATVLGELSKEAKFLDRLQLISAVSGGSVGTMYFAHAMHQAGERKIAAPWAVFESATRSSLGAVAWGAAFPDLFRAFFPFLAKQSMNQEMDRGWALRKAWTRGDPALEAARLSHWEAGTNMPALIFNATVSETGERFVFANYRPAPNSRPVAARKIFYEQFPGNDIAIATAVGSSAAFPYVSPVARARPSTPERGYHLADGGYYDNFGVASTLDFLLDAFQGPSQDRVLAILIEAGPADEFQDSPIEEQRMAFQLTAPPLGLLRMWQIAARARNYSQLDQWGKQVLPRLEVVRFTYRDPDAPTSWHLNAEQKEKVKAQWSRDPENRKAYACVQAWLAGQPCPR